MDYAKAIQERRATMNGQNTRLKASRHSQPELPPLRYPDTVWACDDCGATVEPIVFEIVPGKPRYIRKEFCDCQAGRAAMAEAEKRTTHDEWKRAAEELIKPLNVGVYADYRFGNWDNRRQNGDAIGWKTTTEQYADTVTPGGENWLYICGNYGVGKTHLAVAALRKVAAIRLWQPHIIVWPEICANTKESWGADNGVTESGLWTPARTAKILLIDDIDKTATSGWALEKLYALINHRYTRKTPTIITANHSLEWLQKHWSDDVWQAVLSRITGQLMIAVKMAGTDQRGIKWE